jgi:hypothetical protein
MRWNVKSVKNVHRENLTSRNVASGNVTGACPTKKNENFDAHCYLASFIVFQFQTRCFSLTL